MTHLCTVGGITLPHGPFMIGAGVCKTPASTTEWLQVAPVVSGSYTALKRNGNPGNTAWPGTLNRVTELGYALNSYGMPNIGFVAAADQFAAIQSDHPLIISIAGFSVDDYIQGARTFGQLSTVAALELNFGCPNTQGEHSTIMSFDPNIVWEVMLGIGRLALQKPTWVKLSPYSNPRDLQHMADMLNHCVGLESLAVVTCNTFPNAYAGAGLIDPNSGLAGLSGPALKPIALGQVKQFRHYLDERIDVIGAGGITTGNDIVDFIDAGAAAVQITSLAHWAGNPRSCTDHLFADGAADRFFTYLEATPERND